MAEPSTRAKWRALRSARSSTLKKCLTPPTLSETRFINNLGIIFRTRVKSDLGMSLTDLDEQERDVVRQCLQAAVDGPFFPDWEFGTIFGLERDEVRRVLRSWPEIDETDQNVVTAINNSFNNQEKPSA